jgi:hypothetical protein
LGEENSSFFGSMFITKLKQAGMQRASLPEKERTDFYLYVDEFHNLMTETFENILSEARKYGICLTVAHQYMGQLLEKVQQAVLGNTGTIIVFRVGGEDAVRLEPEMAPIFGVKDMVNLGVQMFYIKETIDGEAYDPFSAQTLKVMPPTHKSFKDEIIKLCREKYAISADAAKNLMEQEESKIMRSSHEKSIIEGKTKNKVEEKGAAMSASPNVASETGEPRPGDSGREAKKEGEEPLI